MDSKEKNFYEATIKILKTQKAVSDARIELLEATLKMIEHVVGSEITIDDRIKMKIKEFIEFCEIGENE